MEIIIAIILVAAFYIQRENHEALKARVAKLEKKVIFRAADKED